MNKISSVPCGNEEHRVLWLQCQGVEFLVLNILYHALPHWGMWFQQERLGAGSEKGAILPGSLREEDIGSSQA